MFYVYSFASVDRQLPESTEPARMERQPAALFLGEENPNGVNLFQISDDFYQSYDNLLQKGYGVVAQIERPTDITETLLFDARRRGQSKYLWELTHGRRGARKIWQPEVSPDSSSGRFYTTTNQGVQIGARKLEDSELNELLAYIAAFLDSAEVTEQIQARLNRRSRTEKSLADFALKNWPGPDAKSRDLRKYKKDYQRREGIIRGIGFTPLAPYIPTKPIIHLAQP